MSHQPAMTAAERQKRFRERRRRGVLVVPVEISEDMLTELVASGLVHEACLEDRGAIAVAVRSVLDEKFRNA